MNSILLNLQFILSYRACGANFANFVVKILHSRMPIQCRYREKVPYLYMEFHEENVSSYHFDQSSAILN